MTEQHPESPAMLVVAAAIVDDLARPRRLLAARRRAPADLAGGWEFPGGKVEPGETPIAALHREIREELLVSIRLGTEVPGPMNGAWPLTAHAHMRVWWAVVESGAPEAATDHDALRWLEHGSWRTVPWLPADREVVTALMGRG